jgi:hypothetical protein
MARKFGKIMGELRRVSDGFQQELRQAMDDTGAATALQEVLHPDVSTDAAKAEPAGTDAIEATGREVVVPPEGDEPAQVVARGPALGPEPSLDTES